MILLDKLYDINSHCASGDSIWDKMQLKRMLRLLLKFGANYILPISLRLSSAKLSEGNSLPLIVSITSFPARINKVWMTIESILVQTHKPQVIILWLSRKQFPNEFDDLPKKLLEQTNRGLLIRFVDDDIRSYKKFYYAFKEYKDSLVVTLDDDLLLPSYFLHSMYECKKSHPNDVIASFGFKFTWDSSIGYIRHISSKIHSGDSGKNLFFGSGGGTLFNTSVFEKMDNIEIIRDLCPTADDIYLNALIRICGHGVTFHLCNPLLDIVNLHNFKLVDHNGNIADASSINAKQLKNLVKYLSSKGYKNPFEIY